MATFSFNFEIKDMTEEVKAAAKEQLLQALVHIGMKMHEMAVKLVPVDTGALKNSIAFRVDPDEQAVYIGNLSAAKQKNCVCPFARVHTISL